MRTIVIACLLSVSACASRSTGPAFAVQCDTVRHLIDDTIQHSPDSRDITAMGHVTSDRAFVYTRRPNGQQDKELWKWADGAWTFAVAMPVTEAPAGGTCAAGRT
jgi:hypothetical protein